MRARAARVRHTCVIQKEPFMTVSLRLSSALMGACLGLLTLSGTAVADDAMQNRSPGAYSMRSLVSDGAVVSSFTDPNMKNGWGIAFNPNAFVWVANNGTGTSTLYDGSGKPQSLVVTIPGAGGSSGTPTGIVFNGSNDFVVTKNGLHGAAKFIFAGEDGTVSGWAPNVDVTNAVLAVDNSGAKSVYKALALAADGTGNFLYLADFHNARVDVFDAGFHPVTWIGAFVDPKLPAGYAPFGIQNLQGNLYVAYAKQDATGHDEIAGQGLGFVNVYDTHGRLIRRIAGGGPLNAPWGIAMAPADFGRFSNALLVGNFGDGRISAFDARSGNFIGQVRGSDGRRLVIPGLWGLAFGNGVDGQPSGTLFFASGPNDEADGMYGRIDAVPGSAARDRDDD
jgi:uncharacterized protein (TIGR03118 family)